MFIKISVLRFEFSHVFKLLKSLAVRGRLSSLFSDKKNLTVIILVCQKTIFNVSLFTVFFL